MYADDTHLTFADNDICSIEASLNQGLSNINRWLIAKKLTLTIKISERSFTQRFDDSMSSFSSEGE